MFTFCCVFLFKSSKPKRKKLSAEEQQELAEEQDAMLEKAKKAAMA